MSDGIIIRSYLSGPVAVVARRGVAASCVKVEAGQSVRSAIEDAISRLPDNPPCSPVRVVRWLAAVAALKLPPTAYRVAIVFADRPDGQWLGNEALGNLLGVGFRRASIATRALVDAGLLARTMEGTRAVYRRTLP